MTTQTAPAKTREYNVVVTFGSNVTKCSWDHAHFVRYANAELVDALAALTPGQSHSIICAGGSYRYTLR